MASALRALISPMGSSSRNITSTPSYDTGNITKVTPDISPSKILSSPGSTEEEEYESGGVGEDVDLSTKNVSYLVHKVNLLRAQVTKERKQRHALKHKYIELSRANDGLISSLNETEGSNMVLKKQCEEKELKIVELQSPLKDRLLFIVILLLLLLS